MKRSAVIIGGTVAAAFGIFVTMAQAQVIFIPYFTPAHIEFHGLDDQYPMNGSVSYAISLKGYGSNCIAFQMQMLRKDGSFPEGEERVAYFSQIQDCRIIDISQGPYNYTKSFSYIGGTVLGKSGEFRVDVDVLDLITRQNYTHTRSFIVEDS